MAITKTKTWTICDVTLREYAYSSGLLEIGLYTPSFLPGCNGVPRCVVTRMEPGNPWFAHLPTTGARGHKHRTRKAAIAEAINAAQAAHEQACADLVAHDAARAATAS